MPKWQAPDTLSGGVSVGGQYLAFDENNQFDTPDGSDFGPLLAPHGITQVSETTKAADAANGGKALTKAQQAKADKAAAEAAANAQAEAEKAAAAQAEEDAAAAALAQQQADEAAAAQAAADAANGQ